MKYQKISMKTYLISLAFLTIVAINNLSPAEKSPTYDESFVQILNPNAKEFCPKTAEQTICYSCLNPECFKSNKSLTDTLVSHTMSVIALTTLTVCFRTTEGSFFNPVVDFESLRRKNIINLKRLLQLTRITCFCTDQAGFTRVLFDALSENFLLLNTVEEMIPWKDALEAQKDDPNRSGTEFDDWIPVCIPDTHQRRPESQGKESKYKPQEVTQDSRPSTTLLLSIMANHLGSCPPPPPLDHSVLTQLLETNKQLLAGYIRRTGRLQTWEKLPDDWEEQLRNLCLIGNFCSWNNDQLCKMDCCWNSLWYVDLRKTRYQMRSTDDQQDFTDWFYWFRKNATDLEPAEMISQLQMKIHRRL
jgi:hypothetical protein